MPLQIIGVLSGIIGFFAHIYWLLILGGVICFITDIFGIASGKLNPLFPILFYIGGYYIVGSFVGVLYAAIIGNIIELLLFPLIFGSTILFSQKKQFKNQKTKQSRFADSAQDDYFKQPAVENIHKLFEIEKQLKEGTYKRKEVSWKSYFKENKQQRVRDLMEQKCKRCGHLKFSHYEITLNLEKRKAGVCNEKGCYCKKFEPAE